MKPVSTNHPSLRGATCYDCGDDHATHGYLDEIDGEFFCEPCGTERSREWTVAERREMQGRRLWANYDQRKRRANRVYFAICTVAMLVTTLITEEFIPNAIAVMICLMSALPLMRPK
jgi:hypothetical protein